VEALGHDELAVLDRDPQVVGVDLVVDHSRDQRKGRGGRDVVDVAQPVVALAGGHGLWLGIRGRRLVLESDRAVRRAVERAELGDGLFLVRTRERGPAAPRTEGQGYWLTVHLAPPGAVSSFWAGTRLGCALIAVSARPPRPRGRVGRR